MAEPQQGFVNYVAQQVVSAIGSIQEEKLMATLRSLTAAPSANWTMLPGFAFTSQEVSNRAGISIDVVNKVLAAFSLSEEARNDGFNSLHDFNITNATPLLRRNAQEFVLFQQVSLLEALYEAPFYWMGADPEYSQIALGHRGRFTEAFARERLEHVFGRAHVHFNVRVLRKKGEALGEIDVLVLFGDRAIVLQAKSKRMTREARKGNDLQIKDDFKKAEDAYDQASLCALALDDPDCKLIDSNGSSVEIAFPLKKIYLMCILADHYPALSFQARQFLNYHSSDKIAPPLATDVFALDAQAEFLDSPLHFLSYLDLRARFGERLIFTHELTCLSYHLKRNLWVESRYDMVTLDDSIAADLDAAMLVRRNGLPGERTPDGILTRRRNTPLGRMLAEIETKPHPATIAFGLLVLQLSEETGGFLNRSIHKVSSAVRKDGLAHDVTAGIAEASTGVTIHCNLEPDAMAAARLQAHCEARKHSQRANTWFGVALRPEDGSIRFGVTLDYLWKPSERMDELLKRFQSSGKKINLARRAGRNAKTGRNSPCPCGSGKKYKRCCLIGRG